MNKNGWEAEMEVILALQWQKIICGGNLLLK